MKSIKLFRKLSCNCSLYFTRAFREKYAEARKFIRTLGLKNRGEWLVYCESTKRPKDIPKRPSRVYEDWISWEDWLGGVIIKSRKKEYKPFEQARSHVHTLRFKNGEEWYNYCKSGKKPRDIPYHPSRVYEEWISMGDWLGTGFVATRNRRFKPYDQAKEYIHTLG